jgi:hypothetical protein
LPGLLVDGPLAVGTIASLKEPVYIGRDALPVVGSEAAKAALPTIKRAAAGNQEYLRNAGRYLEAVLEGRYDPAYQVFSPPSR